VSEKLGNLPGWIRTALEDVADVELGKTPGRADYSDSGEVKIVKFRDLGTNGVDWFTNQRGFLKAAPAPNTPDLRAGDVLVTASAHSSEHVGKKVVFVDHLPRDLKWVSFVGELLRVRAAGPPTLGKLLRYYLMSEEGYRGIQQHIRGGHLLASQARQILVPLCGEQQQIRIVAALDSAFSKLDASVTALERVRANLKRYRASVLKAAVEGRLVPTEAELARREGHDFEPASVLLDRILAERRRRWEESELARMKAAGKPPKDDHWKSKYEEPATVNTTELPELPDGWAYAGLPAIVGASGEGMKTGPFGTLLQKHEHQATGIPVIGIENIEPLRFVPGSKIHISAEKAGDLASYELRAGDLVVSRSGTVGEVCVVPNNLGEARFSTNVMRVRFVSGSPIPEFIAVLLNGSPFVLSQISDLCRGTTRDFLNQRILAAIIFPIPPSAEQRRIVAEVDMHCSVANAIDASLAAAQGRCDRLRQSILKWAFEGKLVDQDPNDEPASVLVERIRSERATATPSTKSRKAGLHITEAAK